MAIFLFQYVSVDFQRFSLGIGGIWTHRGGEGWWALETRTKLFITRSVPFTIIHYRGCAPYNYLLRGMCPVELFITWNVPRTNI